MLTLVGVLTLRLVQDTVLNVVSVWHVSPPQLSGKDDTTGVIRSLRLSDCMLPRLRE